MYAMAIQISKIIEERKISNPNELIDSKKVECEPDISENKSVLYEQSYIVAC